MQTETTTSRSKKTMAVELKGSVFTLPILQIQTTSIADIESELEAHLSKALKFFDNAPVVIDLKMIRNEAQNIDFRELMKLLSKQRLIPVGMKNGTSQQNALAVSAGLAILKEGLNPQRSENNVRAAETPEKPAQDSTITQNPSKIITQPVRSGQQVYAKGGDLIVMASVNAGAEIIADGNIHIYSTMRGRALAGVRGDVKANIFCQSMEAELVAIAGNFRVFEKAIPAEIKSKPVRIHLDDEQLIISRL